MITDNSSIFRAVNSPATALCVFTHSLILPVTQRWWCFTDPQAAHRGGLGAVVWLLKAEDHFAFAKCFDYANLTINFLTLPQP